RRRFASPCRRMRSRGNTAFENSTEDSRRQHCQRIYTDLRLIDAARSVVGDADYAFTFFGLENIADQRNGSENAVDPVDRGDGPAQFQLIGTAVHVALGRKSNRRT